MCRTQGLDELPELDLTRLARELDAVYRRTAKNLPTNGAVHIERSHGRQELARSWPSYRRCLQRKRWPPSSVVPSFRHDHRATRRARHRNKATRQVISLGAQAERSTTMHNDGALELAPS